MGSLPEFPSNARLFHATEWYPVVAILTAVDPHHTCLDLSGDPVRLHDVLCEDGRAQTVGRVIRLLQSFLFRLKRGDDDEGPKDLFSEHPHVGLDIRENGWTHEEPLAVTDILICFATHGEGGTVALARLNVGQHTLILCLCDLRALECFVAERVSDLAGLAYVVFERFHKLVIHAFLDQDAGGSRANLAHV